MLPCLGEFVIPSSVTVLGDVLAVGNDDRVVRVGKKNLHYSNFAPSVQKILSFKAMRSLSQLTLLDQSQRSARRRRSLWYPTSKADIH